MGFLRRITRQRVVQQKDGTWRQVSAEIFLEKAGTQPLGTYIYRRQATVAEWGSLRPILEVCDRETGYEGEGRCREPWWRQTTPRKHLSDMLKDILEEAREWQWKSGRRIEIGEGDRDAEESEDGAGRDGYWYAGMETGEAHVVE